MDLFAEIFESIPAERLVMSNKRDSAVAKLLEEYAVYARRIDWLPEMSGTSTYIDFRSALQTMASEDQVKLAYHYYVNQGTLEADPVPFSPPLPVKREPTGESEKEERVFKLWAAGGAAILFAIIFFIIVGAVLAYTFKRGDTSGDDPVVAGLLNVAAKLAEIFLSAGD